MLAVALLADRLRELVMGLGLCLCGFQHLKLADRLEHGSKVRVEHIPLIARPGKGILFLQTLVVFPTLLLESIPCRQLRTFTQTHQKYILSGPPVQITDTSDFEPDT